MQTVFKKTPVLTDAVLHYCPGCTHGIVHRLIAESLEELCAAGSAIGIGPVGCAAFCYDYFNIDMMIAAHGRAPAVASGAKRADPTKLLFTYQGDGDLAAIGMGEINHVALRGEKICTFFINNAIFGMTGGQLAPTTLVGQKASTAPYGRDPDQAGWPVRVCEMLATHEGSYYLERVALDSTAHIRKARAAIRKALAYQLDGKGFCLVEILSTCPTNWGKSPAEAFEWQKENMFPVYPLGVYQDKGESGNG